MVFGCTINDTRRTATHTALGHIGKNISTETYPEKRSRLAISSRYQDSASFLRTERIPEFPLHYCRSFRKVPSIDLAYRKTLRRPNHCVPS